MRKLSIVVAGFVVVSFLGATLLQASDEKLANVFIKTAPPDAGGFVDPKLEDSVKDMKKYKQSFVVVDDESAADYLLIVVERDERTVSGQRSDKRLVVTLSVRDGAAWKPGIKLEKHHSFWSNAADGVMKEAQKWVRVQKVK